MSSFCAGIVRANTMSWWFRITSSSCMNVISARSAPCTTIAGVSLHNDTSATVFNYQRHRSMHLFYSKHRKHTDSIRSTLKNSSIPTVPTLSPYSHTYYYWYSITHSLFHSRLKAFLFCKSSLPQPFLFLIQVSLYGFPRLFTLLLSISVFLLFIFFCFYTFLVVGSVR